MSWTTANMELSDNQAQIRCIDINRPSIWGGHNYINLSQLDTETIQIATMLSLFFWSLFYEESFTLYILIGIIFTLHLLIIWILAWIPVPSDTLSGFLWVVLAKVTLIRGLLHINAARKVVAVHLMLWWQLSLRYF